MELLWNYIRITLYPLGAVLVCGIMVWACKRLFMGLLGRGGYQAVNITGIIGTPVHELGHAAMCLLFRHRIVELVLWQPDPRDGNLGYVRHTYDPDNLYQRLGNLFIGAGPIFSGMAVLSLLLMLAFPDTWRSYVSALSLLAEEDASVLKIVGAGLGIIPGMIAEFGTGSAPLWLRIPAVLAMLSVSLHISLSPADLQSSANAIVPYLVITLAITLITALLGSTVTGLVVGALESFNAFMMALFTVVLVFAAVQALLALLIRLLLSRFGL